MRLFSVICFLTCSDTVGHHAGYPNLVQCSLLPRFHMHSGCDVPTMLVALNSGSLLSFVGAAAMCNLLEVIQNKFFLGNQSFAHHKRS